PDADRIVYFQGENPVAGITDSNVSIADYLDWANQTDLFSSSAMFAVGSATFPANGSAPERVPRAWVTSGFFTVLGAQPLLGRSLRAEDDWPSGEPVAILSAGLWKRRFGSDPTIIGRQLTVTGRLVTVVGVMAPGVEFPAETQIWSSWSIATENDKRDNRSNS